MKHKLTKTRKKECNCSNKHCKNMITRNEWAYTSSKRKYCAPCGLLENQYADEGMARPAMVFTNV